MLVIRKTHHRIKMSEQQGKGHWKKLAEKLLRGSELKKQTFSNFSWINIPIIFSNLNSNCSNLLEMRNLKEQVKKAFCYQKLI